MRLVFALILSISMNAFSQLPEEWLGKYVGEMTSYDLMGNKKTYHMELKIKEKSDSIYHFVISYGEDSTRQDRNYLLKQQSTNHYILDEQNGIKLDMTYYEDRLISIFEVQNNYLHVSYIRTKKGMRFELTSSIHSEETGGNTFNGDEIPIVYSFKSVSYQIANLKKKK